MYGVLTLFSFPLCSTGLLVRPVDIRYLNRAYQLRWQEAFFSFSWFARLMVILGIFRIHLHSRVNGEIKFKTETNPIMFESDL